MRDHWFILIAVVRYVTMRVFRVMGTIRLLFVRGNFGVGTCS